MTTPIVEDYSREGNGSSPPRFAFEALRRPAPHQVEQEVLSILLAEPNLHFSSLVVRRIADGVCLQGTVEVDETSPDVIDVAKRVRGVYCVLNHLVKTPRRVGALPESSLS
jgi:hypothetical protein